MRRMFRSYIALGIVFLFFGLAVQPAINGGLPERPDLPVVEERGPDIVPGPFRDQAEFAMALINATTNMTDTDADGLPDNVELVLGTDWNNSDSDLDRIGDYAEIMAGSNAMTADSNSDGLADYFEMDNITADIDLDDVPNVWDWDNDGDGVSDSFDISPNARQGRASDFDLRVETTGEPTYLTFQVRSARPDTMSFYLQKWDWPNDNEGMMRDMDNSEEDVSAIPMLELNCSYLPDPAELEEYGITVSGSRAFVPILPVTEFGEVVALKGKMFLPGDGVNRNISVKAKLTWAITGKTDQPQRAIRAASGGYLTCAPDGAVNTSDLAAGDNSTFDWVDYGNNRVAIRAHSGAYLTVGPDGRLAASTDRLEDEGMFDLCNYSGQFSFTAFNGKSLTEMPNGTIYADSVSVSTQQLFTIQDVGYRAQTISLAQYYEDFSVVGFSAEESHRAGVSVISSDNATQIMAAQLKLAYCYIRNSTNESGDISGMLASENITADLLYKECNHTDEAVSSISLDMIPDTLAALPPDRILPVIVAMEEEFACIEMSEYWTGYNPPGGLLSVNLSAEPVLTTRTLRLCWYNTSVNLLLDENAVAEEILTWDLSKESQTVLVGLALAWYAGETFTIQIDDVGANFDVSELSTVNNIVAGIVIGVETMDTISTLYTVFLFSKAAYNAAHINKVQAALELLSGGKITPKFTTITKEFEALETVKCGKLATLGKIMKVVEIVGIVLAIGLAIWAMIAIGNELGWTPTGTAMAVMYFILETAYAIALFYVGSLFPVGTIIAVVIGLIDLITGWIFGTGAFQWLLQQIIKLFVWLFSDMRIRSEVNLDPIDIDVAYGDMDGNGIDVGDNITYTCRVYSNVTITGDGSSSDLADSYLVPEFTARAPSGSNAQTWSGTTNETPITTSTKKSTIYNSSATIQPDKPMANFPMAISLTTDYKVYYSDCWWFFGWWCDRESQSGSNTADWTTIYTDVMPGTIYDFAGWKSIISNDPDGDGLTNPEEQANSTDEWNWDSDGDGLGDKYELQIGTDPRSSDSDGDRLNDGYEFTRGSDPLIEDTDGDGLSDFTEYMGYVIPIDFCNQTFYRMVNSDPMFNDTDEDGLDDYTEWIALLNPRTCDTDGDWVDDQFTGYWMGEITYDSTLEFPPGWTAQPTDAKLTPEGDIIVSFYNSSFIKYWPNGTIQWIKTAPILENAFSLFINSKGTIYICGTEFDSGFRLLTYDKNWNYQGKCTMWGKLCTIDEENNLLYTWEIDGVGIRAYDLDTMSYLYTWPDSGDYKFGMDLLANRDAITAEERWFGEEPEFCVATYFPDGTLRQAFGLYGSGDGEFDFSPLAWYDSESVIDVLKNDFIAVADSGNHRVQMFASNGRFLAKFGALGSDNLSFNETRGIDHDDDHLYVLDYNNKRIQVLNYRLFMNNTLLNVTFTDTDGEGLNDVNETAGWNITVTTQLGGANTYLVTSEPNATDSDSDGLNDSREFNLGCDPRLVDTDGDGLSDMREAKLGTDPAHWDTDGDGLDDATEFSFFSDPKLIDTDGDGLNDSHEFGLGSSPIAPDTDQDGLLDHEEFMLGANLTNPDSDGDFMLDGEEGLQGTDPNGGDSDSDGLSDGFEGLYGTGPLNPDSDGDGLPDGFETSKRMNPLSNDTDGDGLQDGDEMARGLNPFSGDTDGDGVPDSLDTDYLLGPVGDIILVADPEEGLEDFALALSAGANVVNATPQDLLANHTAERNIVLVGRPDSPNGTAGALIGGLLADTGEVYDQMLNSNILHSAVMYGVWAPTQTVIMLSSISDYDAKSVLGTFKSQTVTLIGNGISFRYLNNRSCFMLDGLSTGKVTDSAVMAKLDSMALFNVTVKKHSAGTTPATLDHQNGLGAGEMAVGKYLEIIVDQDIEENILGAHIELYYTAQDLDRTADGDTDDPEDFNESTLSLYRFDEGTNNWTRLSTGLGWVNGTGVNTTDTVRYGTQYLGYIWADVTNLSLFGIGGMISAPPTEAILSLNPGWNLFSFPVLYPVINGTAIACADDLATATGCTMLSIWDPLSQQYINYIPGFNLPTDPENFAIPEDGAVFVWMGGGSALMLNVSGYAPGMRSVHLLPGWNTVGYMHGASADITVWAGQVSCGIYDDICWYDGTTFIHHIFQTDEMQLVPGRGYFVWSDEETWLSY